MKGSKNSISEFASTTLNILQSNNIELEDAEISASEDEEDDTRKHQKLLAAVEIIKGKKGKVFQRNEAGRDIEEFNLSEVVKERVKLKELIKNSKQAASLVSVQKQLKKVSENKKLPVPLSKPEADKIKRNVAYTKVSEEVSKWDPVVKSNRTAEQIIYPLKRPEFYLEEAEEVVKRFQNKNAFEQEIANLLNKSENTLQPDKVLTAAEERALKAMSLAEAKERLAELQKMRALLSYQEARARRHSKIKSKKFHRVLKKEKMKNLLKEFEVLRKTNPNAANEKLQELDKQRILERVTLKHKNTGKWAKYQKLRAKYNLESRSALKEQMSLSHKLTEKVVPHEALTEEKILGSSLSEEQKLDDFLLESYKNSENIHQLPVNDQVFEESFVYKESSVCNEPFERKEPFENKEPIVKKKAKVSKLRANSKKANVTEAKSYICEQSFSSETKILESMVPDDITFGDDVDGSSGLLNIQQAFADEDFVSEFRAEKKAAQESEQPKGIDLFLPGWGSWGGSGINPSKRKRKRFFIKPIVAPRKDDTLGNVIISEEKDNKAAVHQISSLPFPYTNVRQLQDIIRQPIGSTWNTEKGFKSLTAPKVIVNIGKIIDPIDSDALIIQKTKSGSLGKKKMKGAKSGKFKNNIRAKKRNSDSKEIKLDD